MAETGHNVTLWARDPEFATRLQKERRNHRYLPKARFPESLQITASIDEAASASSFWVFATPTHAMRAVANGIASMGTADHIAVSVSKGIENDTLLRTSQILGEVLTTVPSEAIGVLYGPSHAEEVSIGIPTTVVASSHKEETARAIQTVFMSPTLRVYVNLDLIGVEIAGSVKNIMAVAAGISDGLGHGDNTKAAIVTRGIAEIMRLGLALGAKQSTFAGLAGIGDLVVTCMSKYSRNRYLGEQIGAGRTLAEVEAEMQMVAEGVRTTKSVFKLASKLRVEMPITESVYKILFEGKRPEEAGYDLMTRSAKFEAASDEFGGMDYPG